MNPVEKSGIAKAFEQRTSDDARRWFGQRQSLDGVTESIGAIVLEPRQPKSWIFGAAVAFSLLMLFFIAIAGCFIAALAFGVSTFRWHGDLRS